MHDLATYEDWLRSLDTVELFREFRARIAAAWDHVFDGPTQSNRYYDRCHWVASETGRIFLFIAAKESVLWDRNQLAESNRKAAEALKQPKREESSSCAVAKTGPEVSL